MSKEIAREQLDTVLGAVLYHRVDEELAIRAAGKIDDDVFELVLRLSERQEASGRPYTPDQIRAAAVLVGCDQDVTLAMMGFLRSPVTGWYHSIHDPFCGTLVVEDDRHDIVWALYVHRWASGDDAWVCDVILASQADEFSDEFLRGHQYTGDPVRDVVTYRQQYGHA